jgi:hypothetical protein
MPTGIGDNIRPVRDHYDKPSDLLGRGKTYQLDGFRGGLRPASRSKNCRWSEEPFTLAAGGLADFRRKGQCDAPPFKEGLMMLWTSFLDVYTSGHCRPVKQAVSADKGMILNAVLAI